jgi:site-specific recombinase XerD
MLLHGAGLRLTEAVRLRVRDVDLALQLDGGSYPGLI